jgi:hypothetical protein
LTEPVFRGLHALLSVVRDLSERPRWSQGKWSGVRGDRPLPLLCLIRGSAKNEILATLTVRMNEAQPARIPFASVNVDQANEWVKERWTNSARAEPLLPLLDELRHRLLADRFGRGRLSRFRHYRLTDWLTGNHLAPGENRNERADIIEMLRVWHAAAEKPAAAARAGVEEMAASQPVWMKFLVAVFAAWHRPLRFWLWSHAVPLIGREPRWIMRQPFMVPGHSTSFTGFAERLTADRRNEENLCQIKKLLVHAFLQDLRAVYGAGTVRPRRWRRTAYTVVLLEDITEENGGWELLKLINDVRNESTEHDPVLVVATAAQPPSWLRTSDPLPPVSRIEAELDKWQRSLPARRQSLREDARFVIVGLPGAGEQAPENLHESDESAWSKQGDFRPRPVPRLARKSTLLVAVIVVLVASVLTGGRWLWVHLRQDCLPSPREGVAVEWAADTAECVGYSDSSAQLFGEDDRLRKMQAAIFELNDKAQELHEDNPARPVVSVVYFAELTNPRSRPGSADSVTEELTGLLVRQSQDNVVVDDQARPLLRVIVANGGYEMAQARPVVDGLLTPLLRDDPTVMGVLGMGRTVNSTESAIGVLGDQGVPVMTMTLTGESLPGRSPMYFQLVAGNRTQAELVSQYARQQGKTIYVYQPAKKDGYMSSLRDQLEQKTGKDPSRYREWNEAGAGSVTVQCGKNIIAYYGGRETEFPGFLERVLSQCKADMPTVVGDDAVTRFVAQGRSRVQDAFNGVPVSYVSLASRIVLANRSCVEQGKPAGGAGSADQREITTFCAGIKRLHEPSADDDTAWGDLGRKLVEDNKSLPWVGERIGTAYDAASLFVQAVVKNKLRDRIQPSGLAPNRAAIAQEFREMKCPRDPAAPGRSDCFEGATGEIDFSTSRAGETRPIAILTISNIHDISAVPTCTFMINDPVGCAGR